MEPTPDETLLTAYLDGELTPQDRQHIEQRLANEPELRQRLTLLEETWHYLDLLEQESVDAEQIETTLKIAAVSVSAFPFTSSKTHRFNRWGIAVLAGLALFIVTFQMGKRSPFDDPSFRQKVERLDMYRAILDDGIELLRLLAVERVFLPPLPEDVLPITPHEYEPIPQGWMSNASAYLTVGYQHGFDDAELYQLLHRNIQTYRRLSRDKMEQIQRLHHDIETAPRHTELLLTLQNYYHWFKSLQPYEKTELRKPRPITEKVAVISALKTYLERQPWDAQPSMPSEVVGIEESKRLAETLVELMPSRKERLLNDEPIRIINELNQSSFR